MSVDLTTLAAPKAPSKSGGGFIAVIILVIVGFCVYKFFSYRNSKVKNND